MTTVPAESRRGCDGRDRRVVTCGRLFGTGDNKRGGGCIPGAARGPLRDPWGIFGPSARVIIRGPEACPPTLSFQPPHFPPTVAKWLRRRPEPARASRRCGRSTGHTFDTHPGCDTRPE